MMAMTALSLHLYVTSHQYAQLHFCRCPGNWYTYVYYIHIHSCTGNGVSRFSFVVALARHVTHTCTHATFANQAA